MNIISDKIRYLLGRLNFIDIATCHKSGKPCSAYKFLLKIEGDLIYLVDFARARTWNNLKVNPNISLSVMDIESLIDFQLNGIVELLSEGEEYKKLLSELSKKQVSFSTQRVIDGIHREKCHMVFDYPFATRVIIIKIEVKEVVELGPAAELKES